MYVYTAMISNCVAQQDMQRALSLSEQMRSKSLERNVHTYSALMNVCIKSGQLQQVSAGQAAVISSSNNGCRCRRLDGCALSRGASCCSTH